MLVLDSYIFLDSVFFIAQAISYARFTGTAFPIILYASFRYL